MKNKDEQMLLEALFNSHYPALCRYAYSYLKEKSVAEDIVSDIFYKLWKDKVKLHQALNMKAYLFKAVHNNCLYYIRQHKHGTFENALTNELLEQVPNGDKDSMDSMIIDEVASQINSAIQTLPSQQRKVIILKRFEMKKNREIAQELGLAIKTIEMHLANAQANLRKKLQQIGGRSTQKRPAHKLSDTKITQ